jgi:hypothetical protein
MLQRCVFARAARLQHQRVSAVARALHVADTSRRGLPQQAWTFGSLLLFMVLPAP